MLKSVPITTDTTDEAESWFDRDACRQDHGHTPLVNMTIVEMFDEWRKLMRWDGKSHHPRYDTKPKCPDPLLCRCERIWAIEDELMDRQATCTDDVLCQFAVLEQKESGRVVAPPAIVQDNFAWGDKDDRWSAKLYFDHCNAAALLRRVLEDLHRLTKDKVWGAP